MPKRTVKRLLPLAFTVPMHYVEVDVAERIKRRFGRSGLLIPTEAGLEADAGRLTAYAALFERAEALFQEASSPHWTEQWPSHLTLAVIAANEYLEGPLKDGFKSH